MSKAVCGGVSKAVLCGEMSLLPFDSRLLSLDVIHRRQYPHSPSLPSAAISPVTMARAVKVPLLGRVVSLSAGHLKPLLALQPPHDNSTQHLQSLHTRYEEPQNQR